VTGTSPSSASLACSISAGNGSGVRSTVSRSAAPGTAASTGRDPFLDRDGAAAEIEDASPDRRRSTREDQGLGDVLGVLEERAAAERDRVRHPEHGRSDRTVGLLVIP
jgi:hypothetical protein